MPLGPILGCFVASGPGSGGKTVFWIRFLFSGEGGGGGGPRGRAQGGPTTTYVFNDLNHPCYKNPGPELTARGNNTLAETHMNVLFRTSLKKRFRREAN